MEDIPVTMNCGIAMQILCSPFPRKSCISQGRSRRSGWTNPDYPHLPTEVVDRVLRLRVSIHLRLDQPLLSVFIINFAIILFRVGEHMAIVVDSRAGIGEPDTLIPFTTACGGILADSFPGLHNRWPVRDFGLRWGDSPLTRVDGAHWPAAGKTPVRAISTAAPKALAMKLRMENPSSSTAGSPNKRELTTC